MKKHILTIFVASIAGILLLAMIGKRLFTSPYKVSASEQVSFLTSPEAVFSLFDYAMAIKSNDPYLLLIDVRSNQDYAQGHLPNAISIPISSLFNQENSEYIIGRNDLTKVVYGETEADAARALSLLAMKGFTNFKSLNGGYAIAQKYVVTSPTPSYYHYSDEQIKFNYNKLMPGGSRANSQSSTEEVTVDISTPRGGC